jgi:hypothetical protein
MIHVKVRENDLLHVSRSDAEGAQLRAYFLLALNRERNFPPQIGMKRLGTFENLALSRRGAPWPVSTTMTPSLCSMA